MKQVVQSARNGKLSVRDVPAPETPAKGCLLVRTRASLISAGTERLVTDFAKKSLAGKARARPDLVKKVLLKAKRDGIAATLQAVLSRLDEPLPLGYSAAGVVIAVGAGLEGRYRPGDKVAMAGAGLANHADVNVVPESLAAPIPDGVDFGEAAFGTVAAVALHGVRTLGCGLGDVVAVLGAGLVGLLATRLAVLAGSRVVALDYDPRRLEMALKLGAEAALNLAEPGAAEKVKALSGGTGADGILIAAATDSDEPFATAAELARDRARVCLLGMTGTRFSFRDYMQKELTIVVSRSYGPGRYDADFESRGMKYPEGFVRWTETANLAECLRLMAPILDRGGRAAKLDVAPLITHRFPIARAEEAYALVTEATQPHLGVLLDYDAAVPKPAKAFPAARSAAGACVLGVIGAGTFARSVLLPALKKSGAELRTLATHRGVQAEQYAREFGFKGGVTEAEAILADPAIDAVVIATRHDSHADLAARALAAGKSVLVEKPLGLSREEIESVAAARQKSSGFFQVGFNRRFAPKALALRDHLAKIAGPKFLVVRINAGALDGASWIVDPGEGGGRILGEMCHFIDLARFLVGAAITSVQADATQGHGKSCEDATASLRFADGSLATVAYTALGDTSASKERIEAYAGGSVAVLEDFRGLSIVAGGKTLRSGAGRGQDKGFAGEIEAFIAAVRAGGPAPLDEAELVETSLATVAVLESLRLGGRVDL